MLFTAAMSPPQDQVDMLMQQVAEEANIGLQPEMGNKLLDGKVADLTPREKIKDEKTKVAERLMALGPAK